MAPPRFVEVTFTSKKVLSFSSWMSFVHASSSCGCSGTLCETKPQYLTASPLTLAGLYLSPDALKTASNMRFRARTAC